VYQVEKSAATSVGTSRFGKENGILPRKTRYEGEEGEKGGTWSSCRSPEKMRRVPGGKQSCQRMYDREK